MRKICFPLLFTLIATISHAQTTYRLPLDVPPLLSANFGELRNNHFHTGVDFKTYGVGKDVFAVADGFVSRVKIAPGGYGLALYINHPNGHTTVYAHLESYSKRIEEYIKQKQYALESFEIDVSLKQGEITVQKGELIALSGNSGSSGGAHLHFEIRDTKTEDPVDVLNFLDSYIRDTQSPTISGIAFYPIGNNGVVNGKTKPAYLPVNKNKSGSYTDLNLPVYAWGKIGVGVRAFDKMNGTSNIYGVKKVNFLVDGKLLFQSKIDRFSFAKSRMINSFIDFSMWQNNRSFYMKSFVERGNTLPFYKTVNEGYLYINSERDYYCSYQLEDHYGNTTNYSFVIKGKRQTIPDPPRCENYMSPVANNGYYSSDFMLNIPTGNLYSDLCYTHKSESSSAFFSDAVRINDNPIALIDKAVVWIKLKKYPSKGFSKLGVVKVDTPENIHWVGGVYKNDGFEFEVNELGGQYAIDEDTVPPTISVRYPENWTLKKRISIRLTDDKSGIGFYKGEIDGRYALFTHDIKSDYYYYDFDDTRLTKNQKHTLKFLAKDKAGNTDIYSVEFYY